MKRDHDDGVSLAAVDQYMRQVSQIEPLTNEEEVRLLLHVASGVNAQQARDRLVEGYQYVAVKLANRFARDCHHLKLLDFVQEGSLGLLRAIEKYDVSKGVASVKTLAFACMSGYI